MKSYVLIFGILLLFLIAACAQQIETAKPQQTEKVIEVSEDNEAKIIPSISVDEQKIQNDNAVVKKVILDKPGFVAIHKISNGQPSAVIGNSNLLSGENSNVNVRVSGYENENELIAMLHYDDGDNVYNFPKDEDNPASVDGKVVLQKFALIGTEEKEMVESPTPETKSPDVVEIDMIAKQFDFEPSTITVKQGQKIKLSIKSIDVAHGFALPDFNVRERLDPGKEITIEFVADKKGTFTFFCSVFCGSGHGGMKGKLVVE